jgi:hypothetical protein
VSLAVERSVVLDPSENPDDSVVDGDLEVNHRALADLPSTAEISYAAMMEAMRPFREYMKLSRDEKRRVVTERMQEIKIRDYEVVSLYLLGASEGRSESKLRSGHAAACPAGGSLERE